MSICLHNLFEEQAKLHPDLPALKYQDNEISYRELDERSNQLANYLLTSGIKTGDKVCIYITRSVEMMVGILGILKSGAAYVPIDPKTPGERLNFLLDDAESSVLVTNSKLYGEMICEQKIVQLDKETISAYSTDSPNKKIKDTHTAVILYTSGSTGYPKGVLLSHKALVNRLVWDREEYKHTTKDIVLQHASYTFDFSIFEMFTALANGGKLVLACPDFYYEGFYLIELIQREKITKMGSGPSLLNAYIQLPSFEKCTSLKQVFLGGETLHSDLQDTFFKKSSAELINIYGPTETSISVLHWICKRGSKEKIIPIGFPVANMSIYLLDENNEPVSDGVTGEIYISGVGVGSGYHNRPELTAQHFIEDPFSSDKDVRMYRTGDFGKKLPDGSIQFIGRKDHQLKVRGLRIEIEEIEHHVITHKNISACVVSTIELQNNKLKLVAYVILATDYQLNIDEITSYLLSLMPDYMVPSLFVQMSKFPLSPNGKIDRKSLPYPDDVRLLSGVVYTPPTNETQRQLVQIWEKVLELKPIGITDSFYNIGGDSLATLEIHSMMNTEMGCTLPLSYFANASTIQEQSDIILAKSKLTNVSKLIQLRSAGEKTPIVFVMPALEAGIPVPKSFLKYLNPDHPFQVILPFGDATDNIPESIEEIARYYVQLLQSQYPANTYIMGGFSMGGLIAYEMVRILKDKGIPVQLLFFIDTFHPKALTNYHYHIRKRFTFYAKKLIKSNNRDRKLIIKYLHTIGWNMISGFFKKEETHPILRRFQKFIALNPKKKTILRRNKNHSLAIRYKPSPYKGNVVIMSVNDDKNSPIYSVQMMQREREDSLKKWKDDILGKLLVYEIPGTHSSIIKEPNIEIVANIINDHASQNR